MLIGSLVALTETVSGNEDGQCTFQERLRDVPHPIVGEDVYCDVDEDCENYPYFHCKSDHSCEHKDVFPAKGLEVGGIFVFGIIMALCTVAGIGGGGIATSMLEAFFKFETKPAVAVSSFSILICTTMRFFYNFKTKHPSKKHMNVLDYSLATVMMPTTLAGSQMGGYILLMFPSLYIQIALTLLLAFLSYLTFRKAMDMHRKEEAKKAAEANVIEGPDEPLVKDQNPKFEPAGKLNQTNSFGQATGTSF